MSSQELISVKIPRLGRKHYSMWKEEMLVLIKASNPLYIDILEVDPFSPQTKIPATTKEATVIPARCVTKDPSQYTRAEKENVDQDRCLQRIIGDSIDPDLLDIISHLDNTKLLWEHIEILCESTEEIKESRIQTLISQYETFKAKQDDGISQIFDRFNKLINDHKFYGKINIWEIPRPNLYY